MGVCVLELDSNEAQGGMERWVCIRVLCIRIIRICVSFVLLTPTYCCFRLIFGFIGRPLTRALLKGKPQGTFLLRFSDSSIEDTQSSEVPGCITVAVVHENPRKLGEYFVQPWTPVNWDCRITSFSQNKSNFTGYVRYLGHLRFIHFKWS